MNINEIMVFDNKTLADLFKEIYLNSTDKRGKIESLIQDLRNLIGNIGDATQLVPFIAEYLDVSVKNDELLVKLATIVQRLNANSLQSDNTNEYAITEDEKKQLIKQAEQLYSELTKEKVISK